MRLLKDLFELSYLLFIGFLSPFIAFALLIWLSN